MLFYYKIAVTKENQIPINGSYMAQFPNGDIKFFKNGKLHRLYGPAIVKTSGEEEYYQHGQLHNPFGYAIGTKYFLKGEEVDELQWEKDRSEHIEKVKNDFWKDIDNLLDLYGNYVPVEVQNYLRSWLR